MAREGCIPVYTRVLSAEKHTQLTPVLCPRKSITFVIESNSPDFLKLTSHICSMISIRWYRKDGGGRGERKGKKG